MWWVRARAAVAPASDLRPQARPGSSPSKLCDILGKDLRFVLRVEQVSCSGLDVATGSAMSGFLMFMAAPRAEQAAEFPLDGLLEIDENYYGGRSKPESRGCGHTDPNKSLMAIAVETIPASRTRARASRRRAASSGGIRRIPRTMAAAVPLATGTVTDRARCWEPLAGWRSRCRERGSTRPRARPRNGRARRCGLTSGAPSRPIR
jgi:hypothetical protein